MAQDHSMSLRDTLGSPSDCFDRFLWGIEAGVSLGDLTNGTSLSCSLPELRGRSVLIATNDQLKTALALIELDGVARRMVICRPDLPEDSLASIVETAEIDAVISDTADPKVGTVGVPLHVSCSAVVRPSELGGSARNETEWILFTSGTSGKPKMLRHNLGTLTAAIKKTTTQRNEVIWGTFYDIRRYGGLQIFLRAILGNGSFVLSSIRDSVAEYLVRLKTYQATHVSGTASHWRSALWSNAATDLTLRYVRLSGEIADQTVLDSLRSLFPQAGISHAFASTEAGVGFVVTDGLEGFPADLIGTRGDIDIKIERGSLRIRSPGAAIAYLGAQEMLKDEQGFVDTGDIVELRGNRYYFLGRITGVINVGGLKVHPEEVEAVINSHPRVEMSLVRPRKNPILGFVVVADLVLKTNTEPDQGTVQIAQFKQEIVQLCSGALPQHKVPVLINVVPTLEMSSSGKLVRHNA
jgi:acyl-coenzyme A synthetase/AMP-(fatty) acid ligase